MSEIQIPDPLLEFVKQSQVALVISAPRQPDNPIVAMNDSFSRLTGYEAGEVVGRNCRFLQADTAQPKARTMIRRNISGGHETQVILRNYRKSGEPFDNYLFIFPLLGGDGEPTFFVGSQFEIPSAEPSKGLMNHSEILKSGFEDVNQATSGTRSALVQCGSLLTMEARSLIMARLESMP